MPKTRADKNQPKAQLVELEMVDAVNMGQASCVVEGQLTQALQKGEARRDVLDALTVVKFQKLKV